MASASSPVSGFRGLLQFMGVSIFNSSAPAPAPARRTRVGEGPTVGIIHRVMATQPLRVLICSFLSLDPFSAKKGFTDMTALIATCRHFRKVVTLAERVSHPIWLNLSELRMVQARRTGQRPIKPIAITGDPLKDGVDLKPLLERCTHVNLLRDMSTFKLKPPLTWQHLKSLIYGSVVNRGLTSLALDLQEASTFTPPSGRPPPKGYRISGPAGESSEADRKAAFSRQMSGFVDDVHTRFPNISHLTLARAAPEHVLLFAQVFSELRELEVISNPTGLGIFTSFDGPLVEHLNKCPSLKISIVNDEAMVLRALTRPFAYSTYGCPPELAGANIDKLSLTYAPRPDFPLEDLLVSLKCLRELHIRCREHTIPSLFPWVSSSPSLTHLEIHKTHLDMHSSPESAITEAEFHRLMSTCKQLQHGALYGVRGQLIFRYNRIP